jgi:FAD dependent oxidoreductase TIGR03364
MTAPHIVIVGGGIVGLACAWSAADRGFRVTVLERHDPAMGASIRNFGMLWPIGQPVGLLRSIALVGRDRWRLVAADGIIWLNDCGSLHVAHHDDEWRVLQEFEAATSSQGVACRLLNAAETLELNPVVNPTDLRGSLLSREEACVNPRDAIAGLSRWLHVRRRVTIEHSVNVASISGDVVTAAGGRTWSFDELIFCGGSEIDTLFPGLHASLGLRPCKLQMLKTVPQPASKPLTTHIASGLTLRHYRNFENCPSLAEVKRRVAAEKPELDRYGIHVMASQHDDGGLVLGDSHEYDSHVSPFDKAEIDELILRELRDVIAPADWTIASRWHGIYSKHPSAPWIECSPAPRVRVLTGLGGNGMTLSLGLAEHLFDGWHGPATIHR